MAKSPSVTILERDQSSYAVTTSDTILAVVGFGTKGPFNTVTACTSRNDFIEKFGTPPTSSPYAHLAVYRAFNQTNQVLYVRVGDTAGSDAAVTAERVITGDTAGDSKRLRILCEESGSALNGSYIVVDTVEDYANGDSTITIDFYYDGNLKETFSNLSKTDGDTYYFVDVINSDPDNGGSEWITMEVYQPDGDSFFDLADGTYYIGQADGGDSVTWNDAGDTWTSLTGDSHYDFRAGTDGIGDTPGDTIFTNQLQTTSGLANQELWDFHILITPDKSTQTVQGQAITLAEYRDDFIYIADTPYSLAYDDAVEWHNGIGSHGRTTAINSSFAATYWPWLKDYNSSSGEYVWCPPSGFIAEKYLEVDRLYGAWYAVAGDARGKIAAYDYEASPSFAEREIMYGGLNAVNPIVYFNAKGLEIYGQKTLLRANSALNRVNVRRMLIFAKKLIKTAMDQMVFEPHNADSWARATNLINSILEPIRQGGGLDDYRVSINSETNTASLIQQSIMKGVIQLVPVGTIEIIELTINVNAAGTTIEG